VNNILVIPFQITEYFGTAHVVWSQIQFKLLANIPSDSS